MVTVVQLHPASAGAALEPIAEGLEGAERALLARALEFAEPLYAGQRLSTGEAAWAHALGLDWYRGWHGVVVYPGDFRVHRREVDEHGVMHEWEDELAGEAMPGGPVVLSWDAAAHDAAMNVVIHEFTHKLDMLNGDADGLPPLHPGMDLRAWTAAFAAAYQGFCDALERGRDTWLDPYAAEHPSEFFAVVSEAFFTDAAETRRRYPDVYEQLALFYRQDPARRLAA